MSDNGGMADGYSSASVGWVPGGWPGYGEGFGYGNPLGPPPFAGSPVPPSGRLTSGVLGVLVGAFIQDACDRVTGVGAAQYETATGQKFEGLGLKELCDWALEELQDTAVYAAMLAIRIQRVKDAL